MRALRILVLSAGLAAMVACESFSSQGLIATEAGIEAGADVDAGSAIPEAGTPFDAQVVDGGANLLHNGDFEVACAAWTPQQATTREIEGRNGRACLVCGLQNVPVWGISQSVAAAPSTNHVARAWFAAPVDGGSDPVAQAVELALEETSGGSQVLVSTSLAPALGSSWVDVSTALAPSQSRTDAINVVLLARVSGGCFRVDDVSLVRVP